MDQGRRARSHGARAPIPALALGLSLAALAGSSAADPPKPSGTPPPATATAAVARPSAPAASTTAAADPAKEKRSRQVRAVELHDEAKDLYERGLYRRAIAKLEAAIELDPDGKELVYNLALIHEKLAEAGYGFASSSAFTNSACRSRSRLRF